MAAADLPARLPGVQILNLATVTARCEPRVAPVDGLFYRARFYFGSSADSLRLRNIRARPQVSASVTDGERFAVLVHGRAVGIDIDSDSERGFLDYLLEIYVPRYGESYLEFARAHPYVRIDPERMFTFGGVES